MSRQMLKKRAVLPLLSLALAGACAFTGPGASTEYAGVYSQGFEVDSFQPCGSPEQWWVTRGEELRERYRQVATRPYEEVYVVVRGRVGPPGHYGHMGAYARELSVDEVVQVRPAPRGRC